MYMMCYITRARAGTIVGLAANIACLLSVMIQPYMPTVSQTVQAQLNAPATCNIIHDTFVPYLPPGHRIGKVCKIKQNIYSISIFISLHFRINES